MAINSLSFEELVQFHAKRISVLASTNADFIAFETIPSLDEAGAILIVLEEFPEVPAWISFTCRDETRVAHGERLRDCGRLLDSHPQVVAVGINCTAPALILPLLNELRPRQPSSLLSIQTQEKRGMPVAGHGRGRGSRRVGKPLGRLARCGCTCYRRMLPYDSTAHPGIARCL